MYVDPMAHSRSPTYFSFTTYLCFSEAEDGGRRLREERDIDRLGKELQRADIEKGKRNREEGSPCTRGLFLPPRRNIRIACRGRPAVQGNCLMPFLVGMKIGRINRQFVGKRNTGEKQKVSLLIIGTSRKRSRRHTCWPLTVSVTHNKRTIPRLLMTLFRCKKLAAVGLFFVLRVCS